MIIFRKIRKNSLLIADISSSNTLVFIVAGDYSPQLLLAVHFDFSQMKQTDFACANNDKSSFYQSNSENLPLSAFPV